MFSGVDCDTICLALILPIDSDYDCFEMYREEKTMVNTLTLNPAIDKILYLDKVEKGITNRVQRHALTVGGKGTHVSVNLSLMGIANNAFGLARGDAGRFIMRILEDQGVTTRFIFREEDDSRTNYILAENDNTCTTIAEKGPALTEKDLDDIILKLKHHVGFGDSLVLSGDASNCPDPFIYNRIAQELSDKKLKIYLDTSGESLKKGLESSPFLIKPNQDELEALCGFPVESDGEVLRGIASLDRFGIEVVAVSLGRRGAIVRFGREYFKATPAAVQARNTAGCGDSFLAGLIYGYERGMSHAGMLRYATAVSAATAVSPLSVGFDLSYANSILEKCTVEKIQ